MRFKTIALVAGAFILTGCYHVEVSTSATPSQTVVDKPWQSSFIYGLVPPAEVSVKDKCPRGAQKVETLNSPANVGAALLVSILTFGIGGWIWTPSEVKVTCAR
jgi:uncharacterized lipoprotein YajG